MMLIYRALVALFLVTVVSSASTTTSTTTVQPTSTTKTRACADLDTTACQKMLDGRPDLCSDPNLAQSMCPSFCGLCTTTVAPTEVPTTPLPPTTTVSMVTSTCEDIDTSACHLMALNRPDLCMDAGIAGSACKRFCKLCPLTCYNCTGVQDFHNCKTTVQCQQGELCMMKELRSYVDNHMEYEMTCEPRPRCDGGDLSIAFGRRDVSGRDLSVSCCAEDLCNYPEKPTTTARPTTVKPTTAPKVCKKDIIMMVGGSAEIFRSEKDIKTFIIDIVNHLNIGQQASLVSMTKIGNDANKVWDLDTYTNKPALISSIVNRFHISTQDPDIDDAILFVKNYAATSRAGDRPDVDDVVIFISGTNIDTSRKTQMLTNQLHQISNDVIKISIGRRDQSTHVATDVKHDFHVTTASRLSSLSKQVQALICQ